MIAPGTPDPRTLPASYIQTQAYDPARGTKGPPNFGQPVLPHIFTISARYGLSARAYQWADEALRHDRRNAEIMRSETGIMECLEGRQRATALLKWHVQPEDEDSAEQKYMASVLTDVLERTPRFTELRRNLMEAIWYGRYATAHQFEKKRVRGRWCTKMAYWEPRNGDKLVFRYDDGTWQHDPRQVGIRVGAGYTVAPDTRVPFDVMRRKVEATQYGLVYWFDAWERKTIAVHKHMVEDGPFDDHQRSGAIHGVGIRDRIYWTWYGMQECLAHMLEYLERTSLGIEIWHYPANNPQAEEKTRQAAENRIGGGRSIVLVPVFPGEQADLFGVQHIEPGLAGVESLKDIIQNYFGAKIKRYILGQTLTTEAEATGLGSGVADAHLATFADIVQYDATNLQETITEDILRPLQTWNFPGSDDINLRFVIDTQTDDAQAKLAAYYQSWQMGLKIRSEDLYSIIGASKPTGDDEVLENPQMAGGGMEAMLGAVPGMGGPGAPPAANANGQQPPAKPSKEKYALSLDEVEEAAGRADPNPSDAQRDAGNYAKGHLRLHGLDISIENAKGTRRRPDRLDWPPLAAPYGYIRRTTGRDGDHVDVYVGPHPESEIVFVIDQITQGGRFDEHKCVLGCVSESQAKQLYLDCYQKGWKCGPITAMTIKQFKAWLEKGDTTKPVNRQVSKYAASADKARRFRWRLLNRYSTQWKEEDHPRDSAGRFTDRIVEDLRDEGWRDEWIRDLEEKGKSSQWYDEEEGALPESVRAHFGVGTADEDDFGAGDDEDIESERLWARERDEDELLRVSTRLNPPQDEDEQRVAMRYSRDQEFRKVNKRLRMGSTIDELGEEWRILQEACKRPFSDGQEEFVYYRGVRGDFGKFPVGAEVTAHGFVSTSASIQKAAEEFAGPEGVVWEIKAKTGLCLQGVSERDEYEVLQAHGTKYRIVGQSKWQGRTVLHVEEIAADRSDYSRRSARGKRDRYSAQWDESKHPRDQKGRFMDSDSPSGASQPQQPQQPQRLLTDEMRRELIEEGGYTEEDLQDLEENRESSQWFDEDFAEGFPNVADVLRNGPLRMAADMVDRQATEVWKTRGAAAYRIQHNGKPMPRFSANMWTGDEGQSMPGTSGYANLSNVIEDLIEGVSESATGENYSDNVRDDGGEPQLVILIGRSIDGPGAEIVVPNAKVAAVFSEKELRAAYAKAQSLGVDPEDVLRRMR